MAIIEFSGFLNFGNNSIIPRNLQFWDQNMALKWTRDNIAYFGGDPNMVTLGGQSSGIIIIWYNFRRTKFRHN